MLGFIKNKEIKNAGWIIGEKIVQMVLSFVVGILSARYLGPGNYGSLNYTASFVTFFSSVATLGMDGVIIKKMIEQPDKEGSFLGGSIVLRFISSVVTSALVVGVVVFLNPGDTEKLILILLQTIQLLFQTLNIFDSWFQRYLKSKYISIAKIIASIVVMAYKLWLLATSKNVTWFAFSNSLTAIIFAILLLIFYKKSKAPALKWDVKSGLFVLKDSYHYILSGLMVAIYGQMDKIMIGEMLSDNSVGLYTTGIAICSMWVFVPIAIIDSFRPTILTLRQSGHMELYNKRLRQLYSFVIWLCIGVSVVVCLLAPFIISVLYGKEYMGSVNTLRIAIWYETFSMIGTARGIWILAEEKNKYVKYYLAIGSVVNLALNAVMIPVWGIEGAAVATLITQITTSLIAPLFFKATREHTKIVLEAFCLTWWFKDRSASKLKK
ncbi:MAG: flippase [Ruminococcus sp.]|nr:flippase [Ruminococcus sp.]